MKLNFTVSGKMGGCTSAGKFLLLLLVMSFSFLKQTNATHAAGADLTYQCLGGLVYRLELSFYRDCDGTNEPNTLTISYNSNSCGYSRTVTAQKVPLNNGLEITFPCLPEISTCNGGTATGIKKWVYSAVVTLPAACSDWVFSYRICCRNCSITTIQTPCQSNSELYVEATLNNLLAPGNSSPVYNTMPIAFACIGQNFNFNHGVYDTDGDSLVYELIAPKTSDVTDVAWIQPATTQAPMASSTPFTINHITGDINFTPSAFQIGILAMRVNEFRNGQLIGSTIRDMQLYIMNCNNILPVASGINGTSSHIASVCAGDSLCFQIMINDPDSSQSITCTTFNPINGSTLTQSVMSPMLEFCWVPTESDISNQPQTFIVAINDHACPVNGIQTYSYSIFVNGPKPTVSVSNPNCSATLSGSASVNANSPLPCTYLWNTSPSQTASTASGIGAGTYSVVITDQNGCSATELVTLQASFVSPQITSILSGTVLCQGGSNAIIQNQVNGGLAPYTFQWNTGATSPSLTNLNPGIYSVTVTDAHGCTGSDSLLVQAPSSSPVVSLSVVNPVSCYGGTDGSIQAIVSGGTASFTYLWNNGMTTPAISGLTAGNYTLLVTDVNGCSSIASVIVNQPQAPIVASFTSSFISCFGGNNGGLNVFVSGGTLPYTYTWNNGASTQNISGLISGNYSVTVTDINGCTGNFSASVNQPSSDLNVSISSSQQVNCFGGDDGALAVVVSGGLAPYSYSWNHGASTSAIQNLEAGIYEVTVTDFNGCSATYSDSVSQPSAPVLGMTTVTSNVSCHGGTNGSVGLTVNGGTAPYSFLWNTGFSGRDLNNIPAGNYQVTISDANGCTATSSATITQPAIQLGVILSTQPILCFNGTDGSVNSIVDGGSGLLTYLWSTGSTAPQLSGLSSGTYTVTVTDENNCSSLASTIITQPNAPLIPVISVTQPVNCHGETGGELSLTVTGGTEPYTFIWSTGATTQHAENLAAGAYTVTITDANGCNSIISESVTEPVNVVSAPVSVIQPVTCFGGSNGALTVTPSGGTNPYTYLWNTGIQTSGLSGLQAGSYSVVVTDNNGCTTTTAVTLPQPSSGIALTGNVTAANCLNGVSGSISLNISGGTQGYTFLWNNGSPLQNLVDLAPGNYSVVATDANGCTAFGTYEVSGNTEFVLTATGSTIICTGQNVTLIADSAADGTYQWYYDGNPLSGATGMQFITPAAGVYTVSLTNSCGVFISNEIEVEVKSIGDVSVSNTQIICPPETAQLLATGGVTYEWTPETYITFTTVPDPFVSPLKSTFYTVQITNEWGCKTSLSTEVAVVCDTLLVPTGFSPNSDGVNDGYVIDGIENYPGNKLWVYNRWGKLVYKATDYNNSWDGVGNISGSGLGQKVQSGTFYFILDLNDGSKPKAGYLIIRH